jgi:hypothetical protein
MTLRIAIFAACAGTLVLTSAGAALAIGEPIPGIDIVVKKNPGGQAIKVGACQSGGGKVVKQGTKWVCTGMPVTRAGGTQGRIQSDADANKARTKQGNQSNRAGAPAGSDNSRKTGGRSPTIGFAPLRPAEF